MKNGSEIPYSHRNMSENIFERYPSGLLLKQFQPEVFYLKLYASSIWFVVGFIGNAISFLIWVSPRQRRKNSSAVYLAALALSDLFLIILLFVDYLRLYLFYSTPITLNGICQLFQGVFLFLQYYSIVLTFGFTLERWIAICYPFKRHKLCSTRRALISVSSLGFIVACFSVFYAATWEVYQDDCVLSEKWQNETSFPIYLTATESIFSLLVPLATLIFNILVLREIRNIVQSKLVLSKRRSFNFCLRNRNSTGQTLTVNETLVHSAKHNNANAKDQSNFQAATTMLVILSFYLIVCTLPVGIVFVVQMRFTNLPGDISNEEIMSHPSWMEYLTFLKAKEIIDFVCASHYACNFIIYFLTGKSFRQQLLEFLLLRNSRIDATSHMAANFPSSTNRHGQSICGSNQTNQQLMIHKPKRYLKKQISDHIVEPKV